MLLVSSYPGLSVCRELDIDVSQQLKLSACRRMYAKLMTVIPIGQLTQTVFAPNYVVDEDKAKITDTNRTLKTFTATADSGNKVQVCTGHITSCDSLTDTNSSALSVVTVAVRLLPVHQSTLERRLSRLVCSIRLRLLLLRHLQRGDPTGRSLLMELSSCDI